MKWGSDNSIGPDLLPAGPVGFTESWQRNPRRSRRGGDYAKNLAEEACHFVSGRSIRHLLMAYDKPKEQMFIEWPPHKDEHQH